FASASRCTMPVGPEYENEVVNFPASAGAAGFAITKSAAFTTGGCTGSFTAGSAGSLAAIPSSTLSRLDRTASVAGFNPSHSARTVTVPDSRVERTATQLMPHSRSRNGLLIEFVLPLL